MNKTAMVTGASGGIGLEFAERLAKDGYTVTLVARTKDKLEAVVAKLGAGHRALVADLSNPDDIARVCADVRASKYDVLINNAGIGVYGRFAETPLETTQSMLRLNIDSVVQLSHAFLNVAKAGDSLINVSSTLARLALPGATGYTASKAFIMSFSEGLWWENQKRDVFVGALLPGVTKTNFHEAAGGKSDAKPPEAISQTSEQVVEVGMKMLRDRSSPNVLSGFMNKAMVFFTSRMLSRKAVINMMGGNSPVR